MLCTIGCDHGVTLADVGRRDTVLLLSLGLDGYECLHSLFSCHHHEDMPQRAHCAGRRDGQRTLDLTTSLEPSPAEPGLDRPTCSHVSENQ